MPEVFLDRIVGETAVLLFGKRELKLPRSLLPSGALEGEILQFSLARDPEATKRAKAETDALRKKLGKSDDGGDIKL